MDILIELLNSYGQYVKGFFSSISYPGHRLFIGFILVSVLAAYFVFKRQKQISGFAEFLFPKHVWSHPSAKLDVRYFFFHGLIGHFVFYGLAGICLAAGVVAGLGADIGIMDNKLSPHGPWVTGIIAVLFLIIVNLVADFMGWAIHYLQHKIPLLWQFHKVHHAGEVMHPLSNFREHPIDNITYSIFVSLFQGLAWGLLLRVIQYTPSNLEIFGLSAFNILFNVSAYHLRHSHIWLKWPGVLSKVFASPAHHHVHHSRHVDHLDKNFAFMFPIWDVIFGTYYMPEDNKDIEFGIIEDSSELNSCLNLYFIPFRDAYRLFKRPTAQVASKPETATIDA